MFESFSLSNYALMILALGSHYSVGKRLSNQPPIVSCLLGVSLSAFVVATLANFSAGLIRPYILTSISIFAVWTITDGYRALRFRNIRQTHVVTFLLLIGIGLAFFKKPRDRTPECVSQLP